MALEISLRRQEKVLALGVYPAVSLAAARRARDEAKMKLGQLIDPGAARRDAKQALLAEAETSFEKIARMWFEDWKANKAGRHANYVITRLEADAFRAIGAKPVASLTAPMFVHMVKSIEARGAADIARRVMQTCSQIMRYAVAHGYVDRNPIGDVKPGDILRARKQVNFARIEVEELPELMRKIEGYAGAYTRLALKLMALTFVRTGELIGARWQEFDFERAEWKVPAVRTKSRREHLVPLAQQATEILQTLRAAHPDPDRCVGEMLLFPGERDHSVPISNNTLRKALERLGYKGRMTGHGFRGVASTALNEMGYRPDVIEAQLAHVEENRVRAAYNHARYLEEHRELMQSWADYLDAIRRSDTVVPIKRKSAQLAA